MSTVEIIRWDDKYHQDFIDLSVEWLEKYVSVEPADLEILNHPHENVLDDGGEIFFARSAKEKGAERIILYTNHKLTTAIGLYRKFGFSDMSLENNKYIESDMKMQLLLKEIK